MLVRGLTGICVSILLLKHPRVHGPTFAAATMEDNEGDTLGLTLLRSCSRGVLILARKTPLRASGGGRVAAQARGTRAGGSGRAAADRCSGGCAATMAGAQRRRRRLATRLVWREGTGGCHARTCREDRQNTDFYTAFHDFTERGGK